MDDWCGQDNSHHSTATTSAAAAVQVPIVHALETALRAESLPQAILSQLLNLAEFMELQVSMCISFNLCAMCLLLQALRTCWHTQHSE
jgi:hypothetical protein